MLQRIVRALLLLALVVVPLSAHASSGERIESFDSQVILDKGNSAAVEETIVYNFGDASKHGIYRKVPVRTRTVDGKAYHISMAITGITKDGETVPFETTNEGDDVVARIGDPDKEITGSHIYQLRYTLKPVTTNSKAEAGGEQGLFAFNVTGSQWQVPIDSAKVRVTLPGGVTPLARHCYAGPAGSREEGGCVVSDTTATFSQALEPGSGLTIAFDLPPGAVSGYLEAREPTLSERASELLPGLAFIMVCLLLTGIAIIFVIRWYVARRRRDGRTVVAEYEAPDNLTPGEIGYLLDDKSDMKEITATLIDLAVRGYIKIDQLRPKSFLRKAKYQLTLLKAYSDTQDYEVELLDAIFKDDGESKNVVELSDLDRTPMGKAVQAIHKQLKERLSKKGYYGKAKTLKGVWAKVVESGVITQAGADEWAKVAGFQLYLSVAEKDRLKFTDAPERTPERFSALLPYAIALGVEQEWAKQFSDIDVSSATGWYDGGNFTNGYIAASMVHSISTDFGSTVSSTFAAPSGGSGGGFSGGGVGGGGGGSW